MLSKKGPEAVPTQHKNVGESIFARIHAGPVFALVRIQENIFEESFPHISQILEGIHFGANTCRACIRTRANTGQQNPGKICIGFVPAGKSLQSPNAVGRRLHGPNWGLSFVPACHPLTAINGY